MIFCKCPHCKRIKFKVKDVIIWVKLTSAEEFVLDEICLSEYLLALVGGYEEQYEYCYECDLIEKN